MALDFGILQPANISGQLQAGQESAMRNQLAQQQLAAGQQQMETGRMQQEKAGLEMQQFKRRQSALDQFLAHAEKGGQTGDPEEVAQNFYKFAVANGEPQVLMAAQQALMAAKERKAYIASRTPGAPAMPVAPAGSENRLGDFISQIEAKQNAPMPMPAVTGRPIQPDQALNVVSRSEGSPSPIPSANMLAPATAAPVNALAAPAPMAADPAAALQNKIIDLQMRYPSGVAKPEIDMLTKQLEAMQKMHVVGRNLVTSTGQKVFESAQDITPSDIKRLTLERDALALNDPNRKLYDQAIADIGSANRIAQQRLAFDQGKFAWEKANPGFELKEAEDGSIVGVNKRTLQAFPVTVGGAAPAAAPAMPGGGVPGARLPAPSAGPAAPGMAPPAASAPGVPLMGKGTALTESQGNATAYGLRMKEANSILTPLEKTGSKNTGLVSGVVGSTLGLTPFIGEKLEGMTGSVFNALPQILGGLSPEQQKVAQARINFITAVLRKESGAAIGANEFITAEKNYFPKPGDDASVIKQKQTARDLAIKSMEIQAGPGAKNIQKFQPSGGTPGTNANDPLGLGFGG